MRRQRRVLQDQFLDLRREHIHAPHDHHVVAAARDLLHAAESRPRRARQQARQVARAVADHRHRLLGERREDQLAERAVGQHGAGFRVDDLRVEVVFPDRRAVLGLGAFAGHARAHHLRQAVDVHRRQPHASLDHRAHLGRPRLRAEDADSQAGLGRVQPLAYEFVGDGQHVAGRHHDDLRLEIADQLHLPLRLPAAERNHRQPRALRAVMRAQAAGEEPVAVADVNLVAAPRPRRADRARHQPCPGVDIGQRIAHHRRLAGRSRRRMDARDALLRHGEHAERIVLPQIRLGGERKSRQVAKRAQVRRMHARRIELGAVRRHVRVRMGKAVPEPLQLQRLDGIAAGGFDRIERQVGQAGAHAGLLGHHRAGPCRGNSVYIGGDQRSPLSGTGMTWPRICADFPRNMATTSPAWLVTRTS